MTEITARQGILSRPWFQMSPSRPTQIIDPLAFVGALLLAPFMIALLFFWVLLIPVFAIPLGAPMYLTLGTPAYLWLLARGQMGQLQFAALGLLLNFIVVAAIAAGSLASASDVEDTVGMYLFFGSFFAPLWSAAFAYLYGRFRRPRFTPTQP